MTRRCSITCADPMCTERITYESDDPTVPLYCWKHRTREGRHAQVRVVNAKKYYGKGTNQDTEREYP